MRYISFILSVGMYAQPTISNVVVDNVTAYGVRASWSTDVSTTPNSIKWGTSCMDLANTWTLGDTGGSLNKGWFVSGLAPSTAYCLQVCSTSGGMPACSADQEFTTEAAESGITTPPTAPTPVADAAAPTSFDRTITVLSDCSDLQSAIDDAANDDGNDDVRIVIPAGTHCVGRFTLKARSGSNPSGPGWMVLTTDATLPPAGSRMTTQYAANLPRIYSNYMATEGEGASAPACDEVGDTWIKSGSTDPANFWHYCSNTTGPVWTPFSLNAFSGGVPGTCTAQQWYYDSDESDYRSRIYYCYATNKLAHLRIEFNSSNDTFAQLTVEANAKRWAVVGIRPNRIPLPTAYTSVLPTNAGLGIQKTSIHGCFVTSQTTNDRIIWDRMYFDGVGYPNRMKDSYCFANGTNIVVRDSYFYKTNYWRPSTGIEWTPNQILFDGIDGGPALILNNYFEDAHGITVFSSDNGLGFPTDVTVKRNYFYESAADNCFDSTTNGECYTRRHMLELKRGVRWLIEGNTYNGGWPSYNQGADIALSARAGPYVDRDSNMQISDVNVRYNKMMYAPQGFAINYHNDFADKQPLGEARISINNNLLYISGRSSSGSTTGWPVGNNFNGQWIDHGLGGQNVTIANNTLLSMSSPAALPNLLSHAWDQPNSRLALYSNTYQFNDNQSAGVWQGGGFAGTTALDNLWISGASPSWVMSANAMRKGSFDGNTYPSGNYRTNTNTDITDALYECSICGDEAAFRPLYNGILAASSSTARGYFGEDNGVNWDLFDVAHGNTRNQRALSITSSAATLAYTVADADTACTVEYGTSSTPGTGSRVTDTPGSRFRTKALSGLSSATLYYYRVYCSTMVSGSFTTAP